MWYILIVCLEFFDPLENCSLIWRGHLCRAAIFELCSALMTIEQWVFFSVPHLLWHGASVYNGHLRGPVTLTPIAERLTVELSLPAFTTWVFLDWDSNTLPSSNALTHCVTAAAKFGIYHYLVKANKSPVLTFIYSFEWSTVICLID